MALYCAEIKVDKLKVSLFFSIQSLIKEKSAWVSDSKNQVSESMTHDGIVLTFQPIGQILTCRSFFLDFLSGGRWFCYATVVYRSKLAMNVEFWYWFFKCSIALVPCIVDCFKKAILQVSFP